ncbi:hypothetical protein AX15_007075 [Amanita polypyramis BW_CC]|nr:hypothetical protein AX15_007075 [Amanita polypyramis BW_CC]
MATIMADQALFTCLSCTIAFLSAEEQRLHYRSDHHRYNMKRRVAGLPPVSASVFNEKVLERRQETAVAISPKDITCSVCSKVYATENAYKTHLSSKKHRENELKANSKSATTQIPENDTTKTSSDPSEGERADNLSQKLTSITLSENSEEDGIAPAIDQKIAAARTRISISECLFCTNASTSLEENLAHMSLSHSFFVPDAEYLVDLSGLITYLGEKIAVGNVCIYCNAKSREFRTLEAVRKHMIDKSHCKIAYETKDDRLEISDFYDFSSSYPDAGQRKKTRENKKDKEEEQDWEDVEGGDDELDVDEIVDEDASTDDSDEDSLPDNQITYGDTEYELVLPSGTRIGHRSMRRYYSSRLTSRPDLQARSTSAEVALVRRLLDDKNAALVPRKGGFGAFGMGTDVVQARNPGEARNAGRHVREYRDQKRREDFKTRVAFKHNHQKHYRDPLLQ